MSATLEQISHELEQARRDLATLRRLQDAEKRAEELAAAYADAKATEEAAELEKARQTFEARMDGITDLRVERHSAEATGDALLHRAYRITYAKPRWNMYTQTNAISESVVEGFAALPPEARLYLIHKAPHQIPEEIMALAPGDPAEALAQYARAQRRGYL